LNDDQRRRLAVKAKKLGRRELYELTPLVTPETPEMSKTGSNSKLKKLGKVIRKDLMYVPVHSKSGGALR
jgi:hypothetical protein